MYCYVGPAVVTEMKIVTTKLDTLGNYFFHEAPRVQLAITQ